MAADRRRLSLEQALELFKTLETRFRRGTNHPEDLEWTRVQTRLETKPEKLWSLNEMERTGGEPDVVSYDEERDEYIFFDCSPESPAGRRDLCYDYEAWESRKAFKPDGSAVDMALAMGIEMLTEDQYRELQKLGEFDTKTSSWIATPSDIRRLGGALFCDRRYNHVFTYHNGASSYYASRGFRGSLRF